MAKNGKLFIAVAVITLVAGGGLYASPDLLTSPQKEASATQFWSDPDMFISPSSYTGVELEKWFGVVSFSSTRMAQIGFAAKFGNLYTALYYGGNGLTGRAVSSIHQYNENEDGKRVYLSNNLYLDNDEALHNEFAFLLGVADMGFRLSFVTSHRSRKLNDFFVGTSDDPTAWKSLTDEYGSLNPEIAWGMTKELIPGMGLKPHAYIDLDFFRDYRKHDFGDGEIIDKSNNYFNLGVTAAAGGLSLYKRNEFEFGLDLWYILNLKFYNNEYNADGAGTPGNIKKIKGTYTVTPGAADDIVSYTELGYNDHTITPYLYAGWSGERLSLSAELGLNFGLISDKRTEMGLGDGLIKSGEGTKAFTFSFNPNLDLGLQWAIVSDKFFLNVGSGISFFKLALETTEIDTYVDDNKEGDTVKAINNKFDGASTELKVGFTFNITPNLGLQAMGGISTSNNNASLFESGASGLAYFSKILVTLKF